MHVLAALGWTILVLLVLAILAVVLPAKVLVDWRDGEWTLRARVLFLTFRLYPRRSRAKRGTDGTPPPAEQPPEKQPEQAEEKNGEPEKRQEQENQPESETKQEPEKKQEPDGARNGKKHRKKRRRMPWGKIVQSVRTASGFIPPRASLRAGGRHRAVPAGARRGRRADRHPVRPHSGRARHARRGAAQCSAARF